MQAGASDTARGTQLAQAAGATHLEMTNPYDTSSNQTAQNSKDQPIPAQNQGNAWDIRSHWSLRNDMSHVSSPGGAGGSDKLQSENPAKPDSAGAGASASRDHSPAAPKGGAAGAEQTWPQGAVANQSSVESNMITNRYGNPSEATSKWNGGSGNGAKGDNAKKAMSENPLDKGIYGKDSWDPTAALGR